MTVSCTSNLGTLFNRCRGLILLETYTVDNTPDFVNKLPSFLNVLREVTGDQQYSMYNLALKDEGEAGYQRVWARVYVRTTKP